MVARRPPPGGQHRRRWLMLAAEMAGLAGSGGRPPADPARADCARLPRIATFTLAGAASADAARDFTLATLCQWGAAERCQDVAIVVWELLANAPRHALPGPGAPLPQRSIRLGLLQLRPGLLRAVAGPSTAAPVPRPPGPRAVTGRGLNRVCALSDRWGYTTSGTGKVCRPCSPNGSPSRLWPNPRRAGTRTLRCSARPGQDATSRRDRRPGPPNTPARYGPHPPCP